MQMAEGMTLIEILVSIAIFAVVIVISSSITTTLTTSRVSQDRLTVNQASQEYFETVTETWRNPTSFGKVDATLSKPRDIPGFGWRLAICEVDVTDVNFACKAGQSVTWTPTSQPTLTPTSSATLMNLSLSYAPTGSGSSFVNGTEIYRR